MPTKDRASIAALHRFKQKIIEARQHNVILVKNMNPMTSGALNASIPSICQTSVFRVGMQPHPSRANAASNFESGFIIRAIVDYFDLHVLRTWVLQQNAPQRLLQVIRSWIVLR